MTREAWENAGERGDLYGCNLPPWEAASTFRNWKAGHGRLVGGGGPKETDGHYNKVHHSEARSMFFASPQLMI